MDMDLFDFNMFYGTEFGLDKASCLEYGDSRMTHAMLFTVVDLDLKGRPIKWCVENSWRDKAGDKGYHVMTDNGFDEYNYEIVVHKSCIPAELLELFLKEDAIHLDPWDPMGALAR